MKISSIYSDRMILQRGKKNTISGITQPLATVTVIFREESYDTKADSNGKWTIDIPAGSSEGSFGPYEMVIKDSTGEEITIKDILFGDLFLLGGQSNMELPVGRTRDLYEDEIHSAMDPCIRMFQVAKEFDFSGEPRILDSGEWSSVTPETVQDFSAIGYFFAKMYRESRKVPVGLVHTAVGGAPVEAFMSEDTIQDTAQKIRATHDLKCQCDGNKNMGCIFCYDKMLMEDRNPKHVEDVKKKDLERISAWHDALENGDPGLKEGWVNKWDESDDVISLPGFFKGTKYEKYFGTLWLQKTVNIPESMTGTDALLAMGTLVDSDKTYLNGELVGATEYRYPPRRYALRKGILKAGENTLTIRLCMDSNIGGAVPDMPYHIKCGNEVISLEGDWKLRKGYECDRLEGETFFIWHPAALFNSMIASIKDISFKAVLFYQGESNCGYPEYYADMLQAMVAEWRSLFGEMLPFYMVEIPYFLGDGPDYIVDPYTKVREAQHEAVKNMSNVYLAEIYDLGQYNELHPQNKKDVARRLFDLYINSWREQE
ncbi:MAG: sialate O-acetylesterase [Lachnospiraceae bacterium]